MHYNREGKYILSDQNNAHASEDMGAGFVALMRELKLSMYEIARTAELADTNSHQAMQRIAEQSMRLIDSYILSARSEYGQIKLDLEPMAIGSVLHEAAHALRGDQVVRIEAKANYPVMTHRAALSGLLASAGSVLQEATSSPLIMRSYVTKRGEVGVGVFAENLDLSAQDLKTSLRLSGRAHMPLARHSAGSGVMLVVADGLARALGGTLEVKRMGRFRGLATVLPRSEQLALV